MRTTWNGSISFGLVTIPVGLAPATTPSARQSDVQFKMLHRECLNPIKQKRWCPVHDASSVPTRSSAAGRSRRASSCRSRTRSSKRSSSATPRARSRSRASSRLTTSTRSTSTAPTSSCPAGTEAQRRPYALLLQAIREQGVVGHRLVRARGQGEARAAEAEGRRTGSRDALYRRGREEPGRDRRGDRSDPGEEGGARSSPSS